MNVAQSPYLHIAHGDTRKPCGARRRPVAVEVDGAAQYVDAERVECRSSEKDVEKEDLAEGIDEIEHLDDDIENYQVVPASPSEAATTGARQHVLDADGTFALGVVIDGRASQVPVRIQR